MRHPTLEETKDFASKLHEGQVDKAGNRYFDHLDRVAGRVFGWCCPIACVHAAYLHDAVEDGKTTPCILESRGYSSEVIDIIELVTKDPEESYPEFIYRIATSGNKSAIRVKIADNLDNSAASRLELLSPEVRDHLTKKYQRARIVLEGALCEID